MLTLERWLKQATAAIRRSEVLGQSNFKLVLLPLHGLNLRPGLYFHHMAVTALNEAGFSAEVVKLAHFDGFRAAGYIRVTHPQLEDVT